MPFFLVVMLMRRTVVACFVGVASEFSLLLPVLSLTSGFERKAAAYGLRAAANSYRLKWHFLCFILLGVTYS